MKVPCEILCDFVHGRHTMVAGQPGVELPQHLALDLERHGLVRITALPVPVAKALSQGAGVSRWHGATVVCLASGPSLTPADVELVRQWREGGDGRRVVVVNTTFRAALWADCLVFVDRAWWGMYREEVTRDFRGAVVTPATGVPGIEKVKFTPPVLNSGAAAIALAHQFGAQRVVMLGYDCKKTHRKVHWHGDHPPGLGNGGSMKDWPEQFNRLSLQLAGFDVVNASRETALTCFKQAELAEALGAAP
jgi:hypothetical protein